MKITGSPKQFMWLFLAFLLAMFLLLRCDAYAQGRLSESNIIRVEQPATKKQKTRGLAVEVSDSTKAQVEPTFTVSAWNGECRFKVDMRPTGTIYNAPIKDVGRKLGQDSVRFHFAGFEADVFARPDGIEWSTVLTAPPARNTFTFNIETEGLEFLRQPDDTVGIAWITPESDTMWWWCADSVVGSYAVYHSSRKNNRRFIRGADTTYEAYGTGKAFHIYRPKAWDDAGDTVWCDLEINEQAGWLRITVDRDFLRDATYPVVIDPHLGYDGLGSLSVIIAYDHWYAYSENRGADDTASADGTLDSIAWGFYETCAVSQAQCLFAMSDRGDTYPDTIRAVATVSSYTGDPPAWMIAAPASATSISDGDVIWAAFRVYCLQVNRWNARYDSDAPHGSTSNHLRRDDTHSDCGAVGTEWVNSSSENYARYSAYIVVTYEEDASSGRRRRMLN